MQQSYLTKLKTLLVTFFLAGCASENEVRVPTQLEVESLGIVDKACLYAIEDVPHDLDKKYMSVKADGATSPLREIGESRDTTGILVLASVQPGVDGECDPLDQVNIVFEGGNGYMTAEYDCENDGNCMLARSRK